ncbi:hypothetical protein ACOME3_001630 [Neoechinorhynchus agilis]
MTRYLPQSSSIPTIPLQMYDIAPTGLILMSAFKEYARQRLLVLKVFERANMNMKRDSPAYISFIDSELSRINFLPFTLVKVWTGIKGDENDLKNEIRIDIISHYALRLAYCTSEDRRRWILQHECELFRYRFQYRLVNRNLLKFFSHYRLNYERISEETKCRFAPQLSQSNPIMSKVTTFSSTSFYKIYFTEVIDLVRSRKVFINKGFAFVPSIDMVSVIASKYRANLSKSLVICSRKAPIVSIQNPRLTKFFTRITSGVNCSKLKAGSSVDNIQCEHLDDLSAKCYPPCMSNLHQALRTHHHLRHQGRLNYWLYLKGIGVPLEENLKLFRGEFVDKYGMDSKKFEREHGYNIRHSYGHEGKRTSYTPYSCLKIITDHPPSVGDYHGCPFKHTNADALRQRLEGAGINGQALDQICSLGANKHFQLACQHFFAVKHGIDDYTQAPAITHPNQYFIDSFRLIYGDNEKGISSTQEPLAEVAESNDTEKKDVD